MITNKGPFQVRIGSVLMPRHQKAAAVFAAALIATAMLASCESGAKTDGPTTSGADMVADVLWSFDKNSVGAIPQGWMISQTNPTEQLAQWRIVEDDSLPPHRRVFSLTDSANYNGTYNLAILESFTFQDLDLTTRVRADAGEEDQGGGPIWRCLDHDNYYICRFNPLESNYRVYYVKEGRRRQLASARLELEAGRWYEIRVTMNGNHIVCYLDGEAMLDVTDDTFARPGMVGFWTKADAVTSFADLAVNTLYGE